MDRYRRRIAILSVGVQLGCPVGRRTEGEIEIARPVEIVFETTQSHTPTRFFFSRVLQPFVVKLLGKTVYQDMRRMEELFRNSNHHSTIAKRTAHVATPARRVPARNTTRSLTHRPAVSAEYPWASCSHLTSTIPHLLADHFLVDLGRAGTTTLPSVETRAAAWTCRPRGTRRTPRSLPRRGAANQPRAAAGVGSTVRNLPANSALVHDERCPMSEGVV
jgi:hypothetical protein